MRDAASTSMPANHPTPVVAPASTRVRTAWLLLALVVAAMAANTLAYAWRTANPLVISDSWHYVDAVVIPFSKGEMDVGDLFYKRGPRDHSQPLRRALTLANYAWFDLDFRSEAVVGVAAVFATLLLIWLMVVSARGGAPRDAPTLVAFAALAGAYLSLNATVVYTWPLLTTSFTNHPLVLAFAWLAWRALQQPTATRLVATALAAMAVGVAADDSGLVASIAVVLACAIHGVRGRAPLRGAPAAASAIAGYAAASMVYRLVSSAPGHGATAFPMREAIASLAGQLSQLKDWVVTPLAASVLQRSTWNEVFGDTAGLAMGVVALVLLAAHVAFWLTVFRGRRNVAAFAATVLMLLFYGLTAAILLGRVVEHSADYLWQPRYSVVWRWHLVALLLMAMAQARAATSRPERATMALMTGAAACFLVVQGMLAHAAWSNTVFQEKFQRNQARQLLAIGAGRVPPKCVSGLVVCRFPEAKRTRTVDFLRDNGLNVFSPAFRARHELDALEP